MWDDFRTSYTTNISHRLCVKHSCEWLLNFFMKWLEIVHDRDVGN